MTKRVLLLLADGFEPLEAAGFTDVMGWANIDGDQPIELVAGFHPRLRATFGLSVIPDQQVSSLNLDDFHALAVPGGFARAGYYDDALSEPFLGVIRHFHGRGQPIASVCVASLALGAAGILAGRRATTYHQPMGSRKAQLEGYGALFVDHPLVTDDNLITSTGPGTAIEVAFALLARLASPAVAEQIRALMRIPPLDKTWSVTPQMA